jgi:hypothetical protein
MRTVLAITGIAAADLLAAGVTAAAPAYADSGTAAYVTGGEGNQYILSCDSASTCNTTTAGTSKTFTVKITGTTSAGCPPCSR